MTCSHSNPSGYAFCGTCGQILPHARCRCGFIVGVNEAYCGRCGVAMVTADFAIRPAVMDADHRFDLVRLAEQALQEKKFIETTHNVRVTQDDIRKLLDKRRKKL